MSDQSIMPSGLTEYLNEETKSVSGYALEDIREQILSFQDSLGEDKEVAVRAVADPFGRAIHIDQIVETEGSFLVFIGVYEDGSNVRLMQHVTQVNIALIAVKPLEEKRRQIGFVTLKPAGNEAE